MTKKSRKSRKVILEPREPRSGWYVGYRGSENTKAISLVLPAGPFPTREKAMKKIEDLDEFAVYIGTKV